MASLSNSLWVIVSLTLAFYALGIAYIPDSALWNWLSNPQDWKELSFDANEGTQQSMWDITNGVLLGTGVLGIMVGLVFFRSDFMVFAGIIGSLIFFGLPLINFFSFLNSILDNRMLVMIITTPLFLYYFFSIIGWWRGNPNM